MHAPGAEDPANVSNNDETEGSCEEQLEATRQENQRLLEENRHLQRASHAFGQLAERLNLELQEERRIGENDRRRSARPDASVRRAAGGSPARDSE
jgi:hypothetical protein